MPEEAALSNQVTGRKVFAKGFPLRTINSKNLIIDVAILRFAEIMTKSSLLCESFDIIWHFHRDNRHICEICLLSFRDAKKFHS
jgi:hypothetical protein